MEEILWALDNRMAVQYKQWIDILAISIIPSQFIHVNFIEDGCLGIELYSHYFVGISLGC